MAMRKSCDVFKTLGDAKTYRVWIYAVEDDRSATKGGNVLDRTIDHCDKGIERLVKFTRDGLAPPGTKPASSKVLVEDK